MIGCFDAVHAPTGQIHQTRCSVETPPPVTDRATVPACMTPWTDGWRATGQNHDLRPQTVQMSGDGQTKETTAASNHDTTIADGGGSSIFIQQHGIRHGRITIRVFRIGILDPTVFGSGILTVLDEHSAGHLCPGTLLNRVPVPLPG